MVYQEKSRQNNELVGPISIFIISYDDEHQNEKWYLRRIRLDDTWVRGLTPIL